MEYFKNHLSLLSIAIYVFLMFGPSLRVVAQEDIYIKVSKFSILVEFYCDRILLTCSDGCAWRQLNLSSSITDDPQAIDKYGMATLSGNMVKKDSIRSNFLFTIKSTKEGVHLEGKEGTAWTTLDFDCSADKCFRLIDGWGMVDSKKK